MSRSATIVISFLMKELKLKYDEAFNFVKDRREIVQPNNGFVEKLKKLEEEIFQV
jgi:protein-tyrosine phosphatase